MSTRLRLCWLVLVACIGAAGPSRAEEPPATQQSDDAPTSRRSGVPPVPEGTIDELLDYIETINDPARSPESRGRRRYHQRKVLANTVEAVDKILAHLPADDPRRTEAVGLKFAALEDLERLGDPKAAEMLAAFAATLDAGRDAALAARARAVAIRAEVNAVLDGGRPDDATALVRRLDALLEAAPDDIGLAETAARLAAQLERMPGASAAARHAYETFVPRLEKSDDERIAGIAARMAGSLRLLSLPGNAMQIRGRLLDGGEFDQQALAGKVVLVDFWATWCGPCVAEIANIREQYDRYHDRGFEVVGISLDDDRAALEQFVAEREIPWRIIVDGAAGDAGGESMADRYGITGIPKCILIGRDGTVVSLNARGRRLADLLAEQFGD
jgi:thiol-disulfide isomerase/thioredoxin